LGGETGRRELEEGGWVIDCFILINFWSVNMSKNIVKIYPIDLKGPRSYFTDLDPKDEVDNLDLIKMKLKIQLLTKKKIVIAASSLFHDVGYKLISQDTGLIESIEQGIIVPAIRNEFESPDEFFDSKKEGFSANSARFFCEYATHSVPWDLDENTNWFKSTFFEHLKNPNSIIRKKIIFEESRLTEFIDSLENEIDNNNDDVRFLRRDRIEHFSNIFDIKTSEYITNYSNLLYRLSGARVVRSEGHFPQSNLTKLGINKNDQKLSDENIFWDIYIESVISYINSASSISQERLNKLSFKEILKIREKLFNIKFEEKYDELIKKAKTKITESDPGQMLFLQEEINDSAKYLNNYFKDKINSELSLNNKVGVAEKALWQLANVIASFIPGVSGIFGMVNNISAIPEITTIVSPKFKDYVNERINLATESVNSMVRLTKNEKQVLLNGYKIILNHGLPDTLFK